MVNEDCISLLVAWSLVTRVRIQGGDQGRHWVQWVGSDSAMGDSCMAGTWCETRGREVVAGKAGGCEVSIVRSQLLEGTVHLHRWQECRGCVAWVPHRSNPLCPQKDFSDAAHLASALAYGLELRCARSSRMTGLLPFSKHKHLLEPYRLLPTHQLPYSPLLPQSLQPLLSPSQDQLRSLLCGFP